MRIIRELRATSDSVTGGAESVVAAAESLRRGVDTATVAITFCLIMSAAAIWFALTVPDCSCDRHA